jgi:streptogramin lyase
VYLTDTGRNYIVKFDSSGDYILEWGGTGSGQGQFNTPGGIALDSLGNVYVTEYGNSRVQKFDSDGNFIATWGTNGTADGQFTGVLSIAIDAADDVYIGDIFSGEIQKFDSDGNFLGKWGTSGTGDGQFERANGIAISSLGDIYVADSADNTIQKFDSNGVFISKWSTPGAIDGDLYNVIGVAIGPGDVLYAVVANENHVYKFDADGALIMGWGSIGSGSGQFDYPSGIATDAGGHVYITEKNNHRLQKFTSSGEQVFFSDCSLSDSCSAGADYPSSSDSVVIGPDTTVTVPAGETALKSLYIRNGGTLSHSSIDALTVTDGWGNESVLVDAKGPWGMGMQTGADGFPRIAYVNFDAETLNYIRCTDEDCSTSVQAEVANDAYQSEDPGTSEILSLGPDGFARIIYLDTNLNLNLVRCLDADCVTKSIIPVDTNSNNAPGLYGMSTIMGSDGLPRIAYANCGSDYDVHFVRFTDADTPGVNTNLTSVGVAIECTPYAAVSSMALGPDGFVRMAYADGNDGELKLARCTDDACASPVITSIVTDVSNDPGYYGVVTRTGSDGFPRVAYVDGADSYTLHLAVCTDADCTSPTITDLVNTDGRTFNNNFGMDLRTGDLASISYQDADGSLHLLNCTTAICSSYGDVNLELQYGIGGGAPVIIDPNNLPRIAYSDYYTGLYYSIIQEAGNVFAPEEEEVPPEEEEDTRTYGSSSSSQTPTPLATPSVPDLVPDTRVCQAGHLFNILTGARCSSTPPSSGIEASSSTAPATAGAPVLFTKYLSLGSRGPDVYILQKLLNSLGFVIATTGPGSPGNETDYFGALTKAAVIKYQKAKGIDPIGVVGPATRASLNAGI